MTKWTGILSDLIGGDAHIEVRLPEAFEKDNQSVLETELVLSFSGDFSKPDFTSPIKVQIVENKVKISHKIDTKTGVITFDFEGEIMDADPYARKAIMGCYTTKESKQSVFKGGGLILWNFVRSEGNEK